MKKKGLIISTVVMVVVLLASLTTATYAWFSSTATASIGNIEVSVGATSNVKIGMFGGGDSTTSTANYYYGAVYYNEGEESWNGTDLGLGTYIDTGLTLAVDAAVGSGTEIDDSWVMDEEYTSANDLCTGSGATFDDLKNVGPAIINGSIDDKNVDVIDMNLGIKANGEGLTGTYCKITITPNDSIMGMITALYFEINVGGSTYAGDIFDSMATKLHWDSTVPAAREVVFWFLIDKADAGDTLETGDTASVTNFQIKFFISGYDADCNNDAINTSASIKFEFDGMTGAAPENSANWTQLVLA